jgi:hypothetical protein
MAERYQKKTVLNFKQAPDYQSRAHAQVYNSWQQVGQVADQVSNVAFKYLESHVKKEANIAGMLAGQTGKPELKNGWTTYDNAYDKAAIAAYKSSSEVDIIKRSTELREEYKNDPDGMANAYKGWSKGMQETLDPELFNAWQSVHQAYYKNDIGRALAGKQKEDFDANVATVTEGIDVRLTEMLDASYRGDDDTASFLRISLLGDLGLAQEHGLLSKAQVIKYVAQLDREDASNQFLGEFNRTLQSDGGLEKGREMLDNFMKSDVSAEDLGMSRLDMQAKLKTAFRQEEMVQRNRAALAKGQNKAIIAAAEKHTKVVMASLNNGIPVSKEDIKAVDDGFQYLDDTKKKEYIAALDRVVDINTFLKQSSKERENILDALLIGEKGFYTKAVENFESELKDSGVEFLDRFFGPIDELESKEFRPIDLTSPDPEVIKVIKGRLEKVKYYEKTLNRPVPLLTPGESGVISRGLNLMLENKNIDGMMDQITSVNDLFGDLSMEVWQEIAEDKQSGVYAVIGDVARTAQGKRFAHSILLGMSRMQSGEKIKNLDNVVATAIGNAFGDNVSLGEASRQAVQALLMERLSQGLKVDDAIKGGIGVDQAVTDVTGGVYTGKYDPWGWSVNFDYQALLPRGKDKGKFEDWREKPPLSVYEGMDSSLTMEKKKELIEEGILVSIDYGRYHILFPNKDNSRLLKVKNRDGSAPFILDAN